ncbi:hypothetical protein [Acidithiobacillus sp.]|uniref:hypothetical protein n=1 Tax=Acidithiobacillus sp. TaxID=1872118 RepID=UPI002608B69A|nr:hypothetical protein [Acidithiobacillus sp.]MDD2749904.1 hypothetical protein [Acidithiobacillus sp.]MDD5280149.1 hypothetical protein [Acidithiobacillus sp.]
MKKLWLLALFVVPTFADASVMICEGPGHPVSMGSNFNPQNAMRHYTTELNTQIWHCNNGVSANFPSLLKSYHLLKIEPSVVYNLSTQPPYKQGSYGLAIFNSEKKKLTHK